LPSELEVVVTFHHEYTLKFSKDINLQTAAVFPLGKFAQFIMKFSKPVELNRR
jgi:hypothetical protein